MFIQHPQLARRHTVEHSIRSLLHCDLLSREQGRVVCSVMLMGGSGAKSNWVNYVTGASRDALAEWMTLNGAVPHLVSEIHWFDHSWTTRAFGRCLQWIKYGKDMRLWMHRSLPPSNEVSKVNVEKAKKTSSSSSSSSGLLNGGNASSRNSNGSSGSSGNEVDQDVAMTIVGATASESTASSIMDSNGMKKTPSTAMHERCYASLDAKLLSIVERLTRATTEIEQQQNRVYLKKIDNAPFTTYHEAIIEVDWSITRSVQWSFQSNKPTEFQICTACPRQGYDLGDSATTSEQHNNNDAHPLPILVKGFESDDGDGEIAPLERYVLLAETGVSDGGSIDWPVDRARTRGLVVLRWSISQQQQQQQQPSPGATNGHKSELTSLLLANNLQQSICIDYRYKLIPRSTSDSNSSLGIPANATGYRQNSGREVPVVEPYSISNLRSINSLHGFSSNGMMYQMTGTMENIGSIGSIGSVSSISPSISPPSSDGPNNATLSYPLPSSL